MEFNIAILLAAMGIVLLEMSEATAVGLALYGDSKKSSVFLWVSLGVLAIFIPTAIAGNFISYFPVFYVRIFSALLLLYFGIRLIRSARRSVKFSIGIKPSGKGESHEEKGLNATAFSVGAVEAFEAAIVLVALFPNSYFSTLVGVVIGVVLVIIAALILHNQIRKVKQAIMKVVVSALLLTFSAFWFGESVMVLSDLYLIPLFVVFFLIVYYISHRGLTFGNSRSNADQDR